MQGKTALAYSESSPPIPTNWRGYIKAVGPGLVVGMGWLGSGSLIDSSVAGTNYGYALMWALPIGLICRYVFVSAIAKGYMCNAHGDPSVFAAYGRLWRWLPLAVGVIAFISGFTSQVAAAVGVGTAIHHLLGSPIGGEWGIFLWTAVASALTILLLTSRRQYRRLEVVARIAVAVLLAVFLGSAITSTPDGIAIARGLAFGVPANEGLYGALLVLAALIGTVGLSSSNLIYPEFLRTKGWNTPRYRTLQRWDLSVGVLAVIVVELSVWIVGAEIARPQGMEISGVTDLASVLGHAVGYIGPTIFWIGLFFATYTTFTAQASGFTRILINSIRATYRSGEDKHHSVETHPLFNWIQTGVMLTTPVIFALPIFPGVVALTILSGATLAALSPFILVAVIWSANSKRVVLEGHLNRWWENVLLIAIAGVGLWAVYGTVAGIISSLS